MTMKAKSDSWQRNSLDEQEMVGANRDRIHRNHHLTHFQPNLNNPDGPRRRRAASALCDDRTECLASPLRPFAPLATPLAAPAEAPQASSVEWDSLTEDAFYQVEAWEDDDDLWLPVSDARHKEQLPTATPLTTATHHSSDDSQDSDGAGTSQGKKRTKHINPATPSSDSDDEPPLRKKQRSASPSSDDDQPQQPRRSGAKRRFEEATCDLRVMKVAKRESDDSSSDSDPEKLMIATFSDKDSDDEINIFAPATKKVIVHGVPLAVPGERPATPYPFLYNDSDSDDALDYYLFNRGM